MLRTREDLPVARRQQATKRPRPFPIGPVVLSVSLALGGGLAALFLLQEQLLERWIPPAGLVEGIEARPDGDGRLLGHFPYPEAAESELVEIWPGIRLQRDAAAELRRLLADARRDGIRLTVVSAFRSVDIQNEVFFNMKSLRNQSADERAKVSAPPGYSEHSTGYAVDLGDGWAPETNLSQSFEQTEAYRWLQNHAARYHFVLSFPAGNSQGVLYEPWHWRFEGTADALRMFEAARRFSKRGS